ncbi:NlpC/P60 family protein [uncultured Exiguobacterium sp.]|uniref:XkdQ/YqbQ family protein n=1 Tax=uncultured Exiguobacterium sp. TaxID=202669 RepID=UPI0025F7B7E9|nr:NlpC/P60 family protein [uncultured Exiguobacterium sp.]
MNKLGNSNGDGTAGARKIKNRYVYNTDIIDESKPENVKLRYYDGKYLTDFTSMTTGFTWSGNKNDLFRALQIDMVTSPDQAKQDFLPSVGRQIRCYGGDTELFRGVVVEVTRSGDGKASITAFDELWYTTRNTIDYVTKGGNTATQILKQIFKKYDIAYGSMTDSKYKFGRKVFLKKTIAEIIDILIWEMYEATGIKYTVEVRGGKVVMSQVIPQSIRFRIERGTNMTGILVKTTIEGMATQVLVTGGEDEQKGLRVLKKDTSGIKRYGTLQYAEHRCNVRKSGDIMQYAAKALARRKLPIKTVSVQAIGHFGVKCGDVVYVKDSTTGVNSRYWVTSDSHSIDGTGKHIMDLTLAKSWLLRVANYAPPSEPTMNTATPTGSDAAIGTKAPYKYLTQFVRKYETGNAGSATIYNDKKYGGLSYGFYQMATRAGTPQKFVKWIAGKDDEIYERLGNKIGSVNQLNGPFAKEWIAVAKRYKSRFTELEHAYAKHFYYEEARKGIRGKINVDINKRSWALQAALLSTAIQFGVGSKTSLKGAIPIFSKTHLKGISDDAWIRAIYEDKTRRFPVTKTRFVNEKADALAMLKKQIDLLARNKPEPKPSKANKSSVRNKVVSIARSKKGKLKYNLAGGNPLLNGSNVGDCSDFVQYVFKQAGVSGTVPNYTPDIWKKYKHIGRQSARPGDLVLFSGTIPGRGKGIPSHVGIVVGDGDMVNLQSYGCKEEKYGSGYWGDYLLGFARVLD